MTFKAKSTCLHVLQVAEGKYHPKYIKENSKNISHFINFHFLKTELCKIIQYLEESFSYVIF